MASMSAPITSKPDLRDLARQIRQLAQTHPCWSQAHAAVAALEEHLCAMARIHEANRELLELRRLVDHEWREDLEKAAERSTAP
jgi:hypothetical protein